MEERNARRTRKRPDISVTRVRSALTNGSQLFLGDVREDTSTARRFRDLLRAHEADLGGADILSEGQRAIIRRAAMIELQLELLEARFADNGGAASAPELEAYQRSSNSLRRLLESLGLHRGRKARDITTVSEYVRERYGDRSEREREEVPA